MQTNRILRARSDRELLDLLGASPAESVRESRFLATRLPSDALRSALAADVETLLDGHDLDCQHEFLVGGRSARVERLFAPTESSAGNRGVDRGRLTEALDAGGTLRLNGIEDQLPALTPLLSALDGVTGTRITANLYLSTQPTPGLAAHTDHHDVIVLGLSGSKAWEVAAGTHRPVRDDEREQILPDHARRYLVGPGTVLVLPRGHIHQATTVEGPALHLSLGIRRPHGHKLCEDLGWEPPSDDRGRSDLDPLGQPGEEPEWILEAAASQWNDLDHWWSQWALWVEPRRPSMAPDDSLRENGVWHWSAPAGFRLTADGTRLATGGVVLGGSEAALADVLAVAREPEWRRSDLARLRIGPSFDAMIDARLLQPSFPM